MHDGKLLRRVRRTTAAFGLLLLAPVFALAGEHRLGLPRGAGQATYTAECGSCHIAYPPQLLSATGWSRLMAGLDRHFGEDAGLDPAASRTLGLYLSANAGAERRFGARTLRISATPWFRDEHDEVPASAWTSPPVRSAANCPACHLHADRGDFSERGVRLPAQARP